MQRCKLRKLCTTISHHVKGFSQLTSSIASSHLSRRHRDSCPSEQAQNTNPVGLGLAHCCIAIVFVPTQQTYRGTIVWQKIFGYPRTCLQIHHVNPSFSSPLSPNPPPLHPTPLPFALTSGLGVGIAIAKHEHAGKRLKHPYVFPVKVWGPKKSECKKVPVNTHWESSLLFTENASENDTAMNHQTVHTFGWASNIHPI